MKCTIHYLTILLFAASCSSKVTPTAEVKYLSTRDGVINLRSTGYCALASKDEDCADEALKNAFTTLFYRGIPGSQQSTPLIGIDEKGKTNNEKYLTELFASGNYKTFITAYNIYGTAQKLKKQKRITTDLSINLTALRAALEKQNVIPPFGLR